MDKYRFERFDGAQITEDMLEEAANLFSENYGVWSEHAAQLTGKFAKAGNRVRLSKERVRSECIPKRNSCSYVKVSVDDHLVGNALACRWTVHGKAVCWVTQLVVHRDYRERGLASGLLSRLRQDGDDAYGILSSHPAACLAAATAFGGSINDISLDYMKDNARSIMTASPVPYVRDAKLRGSLFTSDDVSGVVSSGDTEFHVGHDEPLEVLARVRSKTKWPLGELLEGYEFLLIIQARHHFTFASPSEPGSGFF